MTRRREVVDNRLCTMMLQPFRLGVVEATQTKYHEQGANSDNEPTPFRFHDGIPTVGHSHGATPLSGIMRLSWREIPLHEGDCLPGEPAYVLLLDRRVEEAVEARQ